MRTTMLVLAVFTAVAVFASVPAQAGPCFDWSCSGTDTRACSFNASCSTASPYVWKYDFAFGDGSDTGLTGNANQNHSYASGYDANVTLTIYFFSGSGYASVTCDIPYHVLPFGPQPPFSGRCQ
jgi:hypothetical protein